MFSPGVEYLLEETGPFVESNYEEKKGKCKDAKILIIGAGGLGCELLKCLAFNGFKHIDIIDMDTIDYSNLNRQFLFRKKDVGQYKSEVAAKYIKDRVKGRFEHDIEINAHTCKIQTLDDEYYEKFDLVIGGLDNLEARFWLNRKLVSIASKTNKIIPYIDGGTTSWDGNIMVVFPSKTACYKCLDPAPDKSNFQMCTLASNPRKPEHCVMYAHSNWGDKTIFDFFDNTDPFDVDNDEHLNTVLKAARLHAKNHNLDFNIDEKFARKVIKKTVPAIASTQAIIASWCCTEALKILTECAPVFDNKVNEKGLFHNQMNYYGNSDFKGINMEIMTILRVKCCEACSGAQTMIYDENETIENFMKRIAEEKLLPSEVVSLMQDVEPKKKTICNKKLKMNLKNLKKTFSELEIKAPAVLVAYSKDWDECKILLKKKE